MPYKVIKKGFKKSKAIFKTKDEAEKQAKRWLPNVSYRIVKVKK